MRYWQFKFNMKKGNWDEFETITAGERFSQETSRKLLMDSIGDIVFYYRSDTKIGIWFIAQVISNPYKDDNTSGYSLDLQIVKRLDEKYDYTSDFPKMHNYYNTAKIRKRVQRYEIIKDEFEPQKLFDLLMHDTKILDINELVIRDNDTKKINIIKQKYIDNGYLFNPFHNLNLIRGEVKHFAFIGNLLNPYGDHFQDNLFLKYFIQSLLEYADLEDNELLINFINDNPTVQIEKSISDEDDKHIGRIDLWLESDDSIIAVEGKIEAKDNKGQLEKYDTYLKQQSKKSLLIYLTLEKGEEPEKVDKENLSNFHLMNFEQDILDFISYSIDDEKLNKTVKNTLLDYRDALLKYMYKYNLSYEYSFELIQEITKNKKSFEKYFKIIKYYYRNMKICKHSSIEDIANNFEYAKAYIEWMFFEELKDTISDNEEVDILNLSDIKLYNNIEISKDIFVIAKARIKRINYRGRVSIVLNTDHNLIVIDNDYNGLKIRTNEFDNKDDRKFIKLESSVFKSKNISKLLDNEYRAKLIQKVLEKE